MAVSNVSYTKTPQAGEEACVHGEDMYHGSNFIGEQA